MITITAPAKNSEFKSVSDFMEDLGTRLQKLQESNEARLVAFEKRMDAEPQSLPCGWHGAGQRVLNREASVRQGKAVYLCRACAVEQKQLRCTDPVAAAGVPMDVRHATLENFSLHRHEVRQGRGFHSPAHFLKAAREFDAGHVRNLFLCGAPGLGKGHLGAALAKLTLQRGKSVLWVECPHYFRICHQAYEKGDLDAVIDRYIAASLLVLDEVCMRSLPADGEELLFNLIDGRHKAGRRTLLLGNMGAEATRQWLGDRVNDRLRSGGVHFCYGEWSSSRGTQTDYLVRELV